MKTRNLCRSRLREGALYRVTFAPVVGCTPAILDYRILRTYKIGNEMMMDAFVRNSHGEVSRITHHVKIFLRGPSMFEVYHIQFLGYKVSLWSRIKTFLFNPCPP